MQVAVDIGNSNVVVGVYSNGSWVHFWRMPTRKDADTHVFYDIEIRNLVLEAQLKVGQVEGVILSTVVPQLKHIM